MIAIIFELTVRLLASFLVFGVTDDTVVVPGR